ncbi:MAG TPA: hypothetical protein VGF36_11165 [Rhodopila sp.]
MDFDQQGEVGAEGFAHLADVADDVVFVLAMNEAAPGAGERVPFQRGVAGFLHRQGAFDVAFDTIGAAGPAVGIDLDAFAGGAAEDVVERLVGVLGDDVPKGDFDGAPGRHEVERGAAHGEILEHHLGGVADTEGVTADHVFGEVAQQVFGDRFLAGGDVGLTPAVDAAFGFDAAEQQVFGRAGVEQEGFDAGDFHGSVSLATSLARDHGWRLGAGFATPGG